MIGHDFLHPALSTIELVARALLVYLFVLILLRLAGKREIGQMGPTEVVAILLISNAVQNSMNGGDNSLVAGMILATSLIVLSWLLSVLTYRFRSARALFEGKSTILVRDGKIVPEALRKERINERDLRAMLRRQGIRRISDTRNVILGSDGTLDIIPYHVIEDRLGREEG